MNHSCENTSLQNVSVENLQLLFMFMQISYVIWYALNLDIIRIVDLYVFKLACTLIIH